MLNTIPGIDVDKSELSLALLINEKNIYETVSND